MKYKVCQISSAHKRYDARIFRKIAVSLANAGYDSYFLISDDLNDEIINNVKIVSTRTKPKRHFSRIFFSWRILKHKALSLNADLYQIHDPELFKLGHYLKRHNKKVIFDCHEDYRYIAEKSYIPKLFRKLVLKIYLRKEKNVCKKFDGVITVTPTVKERLENCSKRITMITNYPLIENNVKEKTFEGLPSICFGGNCGWKHDQLLKAFELVGTDIVYNFATNPNDPALNLYKKMKGWKNVNFKGYLKFSDLRKVYEDSWIGYAVFPYCAVVNNDEGTLGNTKIFEYMMEGLPVISSDHKIWKSIIEETECGICVKPDDVEDLSKQIKTLINDKKLLIKMSKNGRKAALEKYNWSSQEKILLDFYERILNER